MGSKRVKKKSRMRDLASVASTSSSASTSQVMSQDSRTISNLCYQLPASAVYENNHNNVLAEVDEDDDDNDIYYNQDEDGVDKDAVERFYLKKIQELAERKYELFIRGELVLDRKKKKQIESFDIQEDLYVCEDELVSKVNEMQIDEHQKVASSSRRQQNYVYDEDYEEEYNAKKKQRNKASSSRRPHKAVKDDSYENNKKKNNPKKNIEQIISNDITERLKEHITHHLNGTNIMLVIQKKLFVSDLAESQNRLTMPCNQVQTSEFLTEQERKRLQDRAEIAVPLLGPTLQPFNQPINLVRWKINSTYSYIFRTTWSTFIKENENDLKAGATIQVWSYRKDQKELCFAIAVVKRAD